MKGMSLTIGTVVALTLAIVILIALLFFIPPLMAIGNSTTNGSGTLINLWPF
jgi:hypothetical protein